jgi:hypothetical protein
MYGRYPLGLHANLICLQSAAAPVRTPNTAYYGRGASLTFQHPVSELPPRLGYALVSAPLRER